MGDEDEDDDEPSALHPAQLRLPSPLKVEVSSKTDGKPPPQTSLPPFEATVSVVPLSQKHQDSSHEEPPTSASTSSTEKSAPLKICLASGFTALTEKIGPGPAPVAHSDLEPHVESQEEKENKERKRQEDKKFLEEEKKRLEEEKEILKQKVLEKKKRDEEREVKKSGDAPTRKGAADFFDIIFSEADDELKQAEVETAPEKSANEETRTLKIFGSEAAENVEKEKVIEQRRIKRISLDKEGEEELKCTVCTLEKKCSVCELQEKPPSKPSSRAERVLRQEKWRRERSGERELSSKREDERQLRREEREAKRREKMQRSKEVSSERRSNYLTELMKEGRMRCDEEGPTARVTRMDGRIRVQGNITPEKRKDNKILGIVTIDRNSEEREVQKQEISSKNNKSEEKTKTQGEVEEKVKFAVKDSKKLRSHTPEQEEYLSRLKEEEDEERQPQMRPSSSLGAVVKNQVREDSKESS